MNESAAVGRTKRDDLRAQLESTRAAFHALLNSVSETDWGRPSANSAWTIGELLYHMTTAARFLPADIALIRRAGWLPRPPAFLFHWLNVLYARWGGRRADRASVAQRYDSVHARVVALLDTIGADEWEKGVVYPGWDAHLSGFVTIENLFRYVTHHFEAHAAEIRGVLAER